MSLDRYVRIEQVDREAIRLEHERTLKQSCPWIEEPEKRYTLEGKLPPESAKGGGNQKDWEHIRREVAINLGRFTETMRRELAASLRRVEPQPPIGGGGAPIRGPPVGSERVERNNVILYRVRGIVKEKPGSSYYTSQGIFAYYNRQVIVQSYQTRTGRRVEAYRQIRWYHPDGKQARNPYR